MNGMQTNFHSEDGRLIVESVQDCSAILEDAKRRNVEGLHGSSEMKRAAHFPTVVVQTYLNKTGITFAEFMADKKHIKSMLNDPDLSGFRIWEGRL